MAGVMPMIVGLCTASFAASGVIGQTTSPPKDGEAKKPATEQKPSGDQQQAGAKSRSLSEKLQEDQKTGPAAAKAGPTQPAQAVKPGSDIPKPTVVLKPGEVPGIKFDTTTYDFGRVRSGPDVTHDYWFTNTGNGPLEILRVKPS